MGVERKDLNGFTAINIAAARGHFDTVRFLAKECGAAVNTRSAVGRTPLYYAADKGYTEIVRFLWKECGATVDAKDTSLAAVTAATRGGLWRLPLSLLARGNTLLNCRLLTHRQRVCAQRR